MTQPADPFEMIKNFWASMPGMGAAGMSAPQMPSFDPKDIEKRLGELKQVKQWLEMNLNMMNLQINTMEMQLNTFKGFNPQAKEPDSDIAQAAGAAANAAADAASNAGQAGAQAFAQGTEALKALPWANPNDWLKSMQAVFAQAPAKRGAKRPANGAAHASANAAAKKSPAKKAATKKSPAKRARSQS